MNAPPPAGGTADPRDGAEDAACLAVYLRERDAPGRAHWPRTYAAAMADPLLRRVILALARHVPPAARTRRYDAWEAARLEPEAALVSRPAPLAPLTPAPRWPAAPAPGQLDGKMRAAGEKPDDD